MEMTDAKEALARSQIYAFLAQAFADPDPETLAWLKRGSPATEAALAMIGGTESRAAFTAVCREFDGLDGRGLAAAHLGVFGLGVSGDCPPYEGEYGHPHIFQKTQNLADNAGFFTAFGLAPAPGRADRLDHVAVELEFLHVLAAKEAYALAHGHSADRLGIVRAATRAYLKDHLGRWAPAFAARLESKAQNGLYAALARLLAVFVADELCALDIGPVAADLAPIEPQAEDEPAACQACAATAVLNPAMRGVS